jgi:hypothetical protein
MDSAVEINKRRLAIICLMKQTFTYYHCYIYDHFTAFSMLLYFVGGNKMGRSVWASQDRLFESDI